MDVLAIQNLKKNFGSKEVLRGIDLSVPEHSIFGFIGKNGAGKTTTMKAILGLLKADGGEIYVMGEKVRFGQTNTNECDLVFISVKACCFNINCSIQNSSPLFYTSDFEDLARDYSFHSKFFCIRVHQPRDCFNLMCDVKKRDLFCIIIFESNIRIELVLLFKSFDTELHKSFHVHYTTPARYWKECKGHFHTLVRKD